MKPGRIAGCRRPFSTSLRRERNDGRRFCLRTIRRTILIRPTNTPPYTPFPCIFFTFSDICDGYIRAVFLSNTENSNISLLRFRLYIRADATYICNTHMGHAVARPMCCSNVFAEGKKVKSFQDDIKKLRSWQYGSLNNYPCHPVGNLLESTHYIALTHDSKSHRALYEVFLRLGQLGYSPG